MTVSIAITIKISAHELSLVNDTSIALADGSGYLAEPVVYHELHCLVSGSQKVSTAKQLLIDIQKRLRRHLNLDYYYPNMTEDQRLREGPHIGRTLYSRELPISPSNATQIDHCLEYLRESVMCRGDMTVATFDWAAGKPFSHVYSDHECVNWEKLDGWARNQMVDLSDYSILTPPPLDED